MVAHGSAKLPGPGDIVDGKYRLERMLGQGGMGAVYAARHVKLGHAVAIKLMLEAAGNVEATRRFLNEGRAAVNIQHENVVRGSDLGEENGYAFMVLELLDGEDLDQLLEREIRLEPSVAVDYVIQALRGVAQAHAQGIIHRDLKPANLFLTRRPDGSMVLKVLDFGISKTTGGALDMAPGQLTSTATMLGSPLYMSPEQLRSSKRVDARADIWAIGVILFELMSGERPFNGETLGELFSSILETEAPRLSSRVPSVPPGLEAIVARCLQRRPEDRYQAAAELERELAPFGRTTGAASGSPMAFSGAAPRHQPQSNTAANLAGGGHASGGVTASDGAVTGPYAQHASPAFAAPMAGVASGHGAMARSSPSAVGAPMMPGTVPLGVMSPVNFQHTTGSGGAWQSAAQGPPKSSKGTAAFFVVCGALALAGLGLFVYARYVRPPAGTVAAASSMPTPPASSASVAPPAETVVLPTSAAVAADAAPPPPSANAGAAAVAVKHVGPPAIVAAKAADPPKAAEPPKTAEPPKLAPRPPPSATSNVQNSR